MSKMPGFLSNQSKSEEMARFAKNNGNRNSGDNKGEWFEFKESMSRLVENKEQTISSAADVLSRYAIQLNNSGTTNVKSIAKNLENGLAGFSDSEKAEILTAAMAKIIVNI